MTRLGRARLLAVVGGLLLAIAACGDGQSGSSVTSPTGDSAGRLDFTAPAVGGGTIDVGVTAAGPTVFWFWAPG